MAAEACRLDKLPPSFPPSLPPRSSSGMSHTALVSSWPTSRTHTLLPVSHQSHTVTLSIPLYFIWSRWYVHGASG